MRRIWTLAAVVALTTVATAVLHFADAPSLLTFVVATLALAGLAWTVSFATEQIGERFGPAVTGVLQSTLGNLPELFVVLFALNAGEVVVAKTSIIGSLFANALLVLGLVIVAGAARAEDGVMRFRQRLPNDASTLLLLALFIVVLVGLTPHSSPAGRHIQTISVIAAACILAVYIAWVIPYLRSDTEAGGAMARLPL